jgi:T5SS/PEP-CTERM-associated repeat protein
MDRDDVTELSSFLKQFLGPAHGSGTVNVQSGSTLTVAGPAYIGYAGPGTVNVTTGGQATSYETALGVISGSSGTLIVDGAAGGSLYRVAQNGAYETSSGARSGDLAIGPRGTGTVTVKNGGQVSVDNIVYVGGFHAGELPITQFEGASLGDVASGTGTLNVSEGGQVASGHGFLGYSPGSTGTANVTGADSKWNVAGNLFVGGTDTAAGGTGALNVSDGGLVDVMGDLTIWATGTLRGNGTVTVETSTTLHNHGTIAPGSSTALGTLTVNGNVVFEPGSTYAVKINQSGSDKLEVDGTTTINGGTVKVSSLGTVVGQHDYSIIHATSVTVPEGGGFGNPDTALLTFSVSDSSLAYDPTSVTLHLTAANFNDSTIAPTPNEQQVGTALQSIASSGGRAAPGVRSVEWFDPSGPGAGGRDRERSVPGRGE